jgi:hypothetical protein
MQIAAEKYGLTPIEAKRRKLERISLQSKRNPL